jgi:hypothetical protein
MQQQITAVMHTELGKFRQRGGRDFGGCSQFNLSSLRGRFSQGDDVFILPRLHLILAPKLPHRELVG